MKFSQPYQSDSVELLKSLKNLVQSYQKRFPGLRPYSIRTGVFPQGLIFPACSINPMIENFGGWLSGRRYYQQTQFEVAFWVDEVTRNPERTLFEYSHEFNHILRDFEEYRVADKYQRKQTLNYDLLPSSTDTDVELNNGKRGHKITMPIVFTSKNKVKMENVESLKEYRDWDSEEEMVIYLLEKFQKEYSKTLLSGVKRFIRMNEDISISQPTLKMQIDNSALEHFQTSIDVANNSLSIEVWNRMGHQENLLYQNMDITQNVREILFMDSYLDGYAADSFWQNSSYSIGINKKNVPFFRSSTIWMVKMPEEIEMKGV